MSFTMPYSKLYICANDVKFISVDRQKLDLLKYIYLWYRKFYICRYTAHSTYIKMTLVFKINKNSGEQEKESIIRVRVG